MWVKVPVNMTIVIISYDVMIVSYLITITDRNVFDITKIWLIF